MSRPRRVLVYGDVDLNIIDGSAIWAQSVVQAFAAADCDVTLLLKAPVRTARLLDPLSSLDNVTIVRPFEESLLDGLAEKLTPAQASAIMRHLDDDGPFDVIVVRGLALANRLVEDQAFGGRLWTYLTDIPQDAAAVTPAFAAELNLIAAESRYMLCQTEDLRGFVEAVAPAACGKSVLYPPVLPPAMGAASVRRHAGQQPVELVYIGKFAPRWNTLAMTELTARLAARGVQARLHMVGDKIHRVASDPQFHERMRAALKGSEGVVWHGGQSRDQALAIAAEAHIGLSWRDDGLDPSLELSTKVLEYGSLGLPVILNRTPSHEALLGADYPLFAATFDDVLERVATAAGAPDVYALASERTRSAAADFTLKSATERVQVYLERAFPRAVLRERRDRRLRVVVASHDLKFFSGILDYLRSLSDLEVRVDAWTTLSQHDAAASQRMLDWADVVVCEWCGPNAVWYSQRKRPEQRLIVRLHRFELYGGYTDQVDIDAVDQVVCVSPHYADLTLAQTAWPASKVVVVGNSVDTLMLDRPKVTAARFHLGMIGIAPARKRFDYALDLLERVRRHDRRFVLFAKSKMPWDYWWIWRDAGERRHYEQVFERLGSSPLLRDAVVFDRFGRDVASWLRKIGIVLSTSDDESFHLAPAEAMASGAVPVVRNWPGANTIYGDRWILESADAMAERILQLADYDAWDRERHIAREHVRTAYDLERVNAQWRDLVADRSAWHDVPVLEHPPSVTAVGGKYPRLIFVLGSQRSGTNALRRSLSLDPSVSGFNEQHSSKFYDNWRLRPEPAIRDHLRQFPATVLLKPIKSVIDQPVANLLEEFAEYDLSAVWIYRNPVNVFSSQARRWEYLDDVEKFIKVWNRGNQSALDAVGDRLVIVRYEDLVADSTVFQRLGRHLGVRGENLFASDSRGGYETLDPEVIGRLEAGTADVRGRLDAARAFKAGNGSGRPCQT